MNICHNQSSVELFFLCFSIFLLCTSFLILNYVLSKTFILLTCIAPDACFYCFHVKHFELQLLYEMCYINKVLLTEMTEVFLQFKLIKLISDNLVVMYLNLRIKSVSNHNKSIRSSLKPVPYFIILGKHLCR